MTERTNDTAAGEETKREAKAGAPETAAPSEAGRAAEAAEAEAEAAPSFADFDVILASGSPRRRQLLQNAGVRFSVRAPEIDESLEPDLLAAPGEAVKKLAERKAGAVVQEVLAEDYTGLAMVLGSDTMVVLDGEIFGKPHSRSEAKGMLRKLSGRTHEVMTAVSVWAVMAPEAEKLSLGFRTFVETSRVTFKELDDVDIERYLDAGESYDKAGAYAIQGKGADLVERFEGDYDTIVGLPVTRLLEEYPELRR